MGCSLLHRKFLVSQIEAEDITEAARSRNLTVFVPPEASKVVDHEAAVLLHSPGSSTVVHFSLWASKDTYFLMITLKNWRDVRLLTVLQ